ncbi:MAG: prepilin-type N-terminal cleavage/methylation domain-containing protein [Bacillota bacterium]
MKFLRIRYRLRQVLRSQAGLSLAELLTALAILGFVLGAIYQYFFYAQNSADRAFAEARAIQEARLVMERMGREVREAQPAIEDDEGREKAVERVSAAELRIYTDVDGDGRPEMVCYRLRDDILTLDRGTAEPENDHFPYLYGEPGNWEHVLNRVANTNIFSIPDVDGNPDTPNAREIINVELVVNDPQTPLARPLRICSALTVRSKREAE